VARVASNHLGSAHSEEEVEALKAAARQRLAAGQRELGLGPSVAQAATSGGPLEITSSRMGHLWDALTGAYDALGFTEATAGDEALGAYYRLFQIGKSFRMSRHDLQARPIEQHTRESIEAHLTIVFVALAVTRYLEATTGWTIKRFVRTTRRYRTVHIKAGAQRLVHPGDLRLTPPIAGQRICPCCSKELRPAVD
jgi:hypothetical protein